jgi:predicted nucleotidyltransferase
MVPPDLNDLIERARARIATAVPDVVAVYVFGSAATGHYAPGSDLDIAVLGSRPLLPREAYELARSLEVDLGTDVDLVDLITASTVLKFEVITGGRRIHCGEPRIAIDFEARCMSEYGRYREGLAPLLKSVRETGRAYAR